MVMNVKKYDIDLHMKNHYRRIRSAKCMINNSLPVGYRTRYRYITNKCCSRNAVSLCSLLSKRSQSGPKYKSDSLISSPGPQTKRLESNTPATTSRDTNRREPYGLLKNHGARDYVLDYVCSRRSSVKSSPRQKCIPAPSVARKTPVPTPRTSKYKRRESYEVPNEGSLKTYQNKENDEKLKAGIQSEPNPISLKCRPKESSQTSKLYKLTDTPKSSKCTHKENDTTSKENSSAETTPRKSKKSQCKEASARTCSKKSQTSVVRDSEYDQFTCRIVEDILRNQPIFWKTAQQIFDSHFEANRNRLNEDLMKQHIQKISDILKLQVLSESSDACDCNYTSDNICNKIKRKLLQNSPATEEPTSVTEKEIPKDVLPEEISEEEKFAVEENEKKPSINNVNENPSTNETPTKPENETDAEEQNTNENSKKFSNVLANAKQQEFENEVKLKDADEKEKDPEENLTALDEKRSDVLQVKITSEPELLEPHQLEEIENLEQAQISTDTHSPVIVENIAEISNELKALVKTQQTSVFETSTFPPSIPVSPSYENIAECCGDVEVKEDIDKITEYSFKETHLSENENYEPVPVICGASMFEAHVKTHDYETECKKTAPEQEMSVKCDYVIEKPQAFSTPLSAVEILKNKNLISTSAQTSFVVEKSFFLPSNEELNKFEDPDFISNFKKFSEVHINMLQNSISFTEPKSNTIDSTTDINDPFQEQKQVDTIDSGTDIEGICQCEPCLREKAEKMLEILPLCALEKNSSIQKKRKITKKTNYFKDIPTVQSSSSDYSDTSQSKIICVKKMKASQTTQTDFEYDLCSDQLGSYVY